MKEQASSLSNTVSPDSKISWMLWTKRHAEACLQKVEIISGTRQDIWASLLSIEIACRRSSTTADIKNLEISSNGTRTYFSMKCGFFLQQSHNPSSNPSTMREQLNPGRSTKSSFWCSVELWANFLMRFTIFSQRADFSKSAAKTTVALFDDSITWCKHANM